MSVASRDAVESDIKRLLDDLIQCANTAHARTVLRDAVWSIEDRAFARTDPSSRDMYVEQRVRDILGELSKPNSTQQSLDIALEFIDALLGIDYTDRTNKFTRLCRSLFVILQCGNEVTAKNAQRVFIKMIELDAQCLARDPNASTPLKEFLPKELKDMCETVSREADGRSAPSRSKSLAVMTACEALMKVHPRYVNVQLRSLILGLSVTLCGAADPSVRSAAYDCLFATLCHTSGMRAADLQAESKKLADDCSRLLKAPHNTENQTASIFMSLKALISSRGVAAIEKQQFSTFCTSVLEQHKITRSAQVKAAVCSLIPLIARADLAFASRRVAYCAIVMDPLKNLRDESNKVAELHNMAEFIRNAGYDTLDPAVKVNLESVVLRYVSRLSTQLECWNILAAIAKQEAPSAAAGRSPLVNNVRLPPAAAPTSSHFADLVRRCLPNLSRSSLTAALLEYLECIQKSVPALASDIELAHNTMVDVVLRRAALNENTQSFARSQGSLPSVHSSAFMSPLSPGASANSSGGVGAAPATAGGFGLSRLVSYFNRGGNTNQAHPSTVSDEQQVINVMPEEIEVALIALSKRPVVDSGTLVEELRVNILTLQRHANSNVRRQTSQTILRCLENATSVAFKNGKLSPQSASSVFLSSSVEELLEAYLKNAVMEMEPQCRMAMVEAFCSTSSVMQLINRPRVLNTIVSFLNDSSRIREVVVRALVETCQTLKKDKIDVSCVETQLKITVETCVVALEHSNDRRLLLRHLADLAIFTRFGIDPVLPLMTRTFIALNKKLRDELDIVVLNILKTLKSLVSPLVSNDEAAIAFFDELSDLQRTTLNIMITSTTPAITQEAVKVLVVLNYVVPLFNTASTHVDVVKVIEVLSTTFLSNKLLSTEEVTPVLTLFGQLGAVKPVKVVEARDEEKLASDADLSITNNYAVIVYRSLSRILESSLSETLCCLAMRTLDYLVHATAKNEIGGVHATKAVLNLCKRAETGSLRYEALKHLAALIRLRHESSISFLLTEIVVLLEHLWFTCEGDQFYVMLDVIESLQPGSLSIKDQQDIWPWLYPRLIDAAMRDTSPQRTIAMKIVSILSAAKTVPPHCVPFLTATLTTFIQQSDQPTELRGAAIVAVVELVCSQHLLQHVSPLLHALRTLARHLELSSELSSHKSAYIVKDSLSKLLKHFPASRSIVVGINELLEAGTDETSSSAARMSASEDQTIDSPPAAAQSTTASSRLLDGVSLHAMAATPEAPSQLDVVTQAALGDPNPADVISLHRHVDRGLRITETGKWKEWFTELQRLIVLSSPHYAFRLIIDLYEKHEPLRRELFFASFKCLFETLAPEQSSRLSQALQQAVVSGDGEVSSKCLSLADYLDHSRPLWEAESIGATNTAPSSHSGSRFGQRSAARTARQSQAAESFAFHQSQADCYTPVKRVLQVNDGLDNPDFFRSMASARRLPAASLSTRARTVKVLNSVGEGGSMMFPQTPDAGNLQNRPLQRPPLQQRHGAMSDLAALTLSGDDGSTRGHGESSTAFCFTKRRSSEAGGAPPKPVTLLPGDSPLIPGKVIIEVSQSTAMFDKAIRFLEMRLGSYLAPVISCGHAWRTLPRDVLDTVVLPLAQLYSKLGMQASVVGLFESIHYLESQEASGIGFELLRNWAEARAAYSQAIRSGATKAPLRMAPVTEAERDGYVRTLCLCGEWRSALNVAKEMMRDMGGREAHTSIPVSGATAAWILGEWDEVSRFSKNITHEPMQYFFVNGVVFQRDVCGADQQSCIRDARLSLEASLRALLPVSYAHAYENITMLQHFQEIWEAAAYKRSRTEERRRQIRDTWATRFSAMKSDTWFPKLRSLMVHSLVLSPTEIADTWLQFCESVRATYPQLANWAMRTLQSNRLVSNSTDDIKKDMVELNAANVRVGYFEHLWKTGKLSDAIAGMQLLVRNSSNLQVLDPRSFGQGHLKLGLWKQEVHADSFWKAALRDDIISHLHAAIRACPDDSETWHAWALMNYRIHQRESGLDQASQSVFASKAHQGFVAAICLSSSPQRALTDIIRLLQLWIVYGGVGLLKESIADAIQRISVEHWVQVVPQLIAHLGHESHDVRDVVRRILQKISKAHAQVVVFPLLVNTRVDPNVPPSEATTLRDSEAKNLLDNCIPQRLRMDAENVAKQLCVASSLPIEQIYSHLNRVAEAWSMMVGEGTVEHKNNAHCLRRLSTVVYLHSAHDSVKALGKIDEYVTRAMNDFLSGNVEEALKLVEQLSDEIRDFVKAIQDEDIQRNMGQLAGCRNLTVSVFGEYNWASPAAVPTIASFGSQCEVIRSQRRPRKIRVTGSNGSVYAYLLKSNEDIRLDERVMQLFGLVNSFMDLQRHSPNCAIYKFPVIPISADVGLLGWVEYSDTIYDVVANYRKLSNVDVHLEQKLLADQFDSEPFNELMRRKWLRLTSLQRAEALESVFSSPQCESADLARSMWQRSTSAEVWLERRTAYTESLATMSMVGYILGLGDRHLGNIMLSMSTGRIAHIDFGDSFDVCRIRSSLPETVPFRLTRMFVHGMEVFGVDGVFRSTCVSILSMLHLNRDSIIALLSAFVYDPIVSHQESMQSVMERQRDPKDIVERIRNKLRGLELAVPEEQFKPFDAVPDFSSRPDLVYISNAFNDSAKRDVAMALSPKDQVQMLIGEATNVENLSNIFHGWAPMW